MRKLTCVFMVLAIILSMNSCNNLSTQQENPSQEGETTQIEETTSTEETTPVEETKELTAREKLNDDEDALFNVLVKFTTENFYEPSAVKVLEIGDYTNRSSASSGPSTVVVRLQGENRVGGTLNHYYLICIRSGENTSEMAKPFIALYQSGMNDAKLFGNEEWYNRDHLGMMEYKADLGEYIELDDDYTIEKDASNAFTIGNVNKALKEYWEDMGF